MATPGEDALEALFTTDLVRLYKMHEASGTAFVDDTGNLDGFYVGGAILAETALSQDDGATSVYFDGVDDFAASVGSTGIDVAPPKSVGVLFKTTSAECFLVGTGRTSSNSNNYMVQVLGGKLNAIVRMSSHDIDLVSAADVDDGEMHFAMLVVDSTSSFKLYLDGVLVDSDTTATTSTAFSGGWQTRVANRTRTPATTNLLDGHLEMAFVANAGASDAEVETLWEALSGEGGSVTTVQMIF